MKPWTIDGRAGGRRADQERKEDAMVVIVFRTRLREGVDEQEMERVGARMYALAAGMAGFVSYKDYVAEDGECVSIVEFESPETLAAWRDHPEHREVQARGRSHYFSEYRVQVCTTEREYSFTRAGGRIEGGHAERSDG